MAHSDSAYVFVGGLPYDLTEGDVITIFSQYGEVVNIHLPKPRAEPARDGRQPREVRAPSGHNRGFGFLMYEDQRSTVLAVDNLNGTKVLGRTLRVDHVANFQQERIRDADGNLVEAKEQMLNCAPPEIVLDEEPGEDADLEDPMAAYLADKARKKRRVGHESERRSGRRSEGEHSERSRRSREHDSERERSERHHSRHSDRHSERHSDRHSHRHSDRHSHRHSDHHSHRHSDRHSHRYTERHSDRPSRDAEHEPAPDRARSATPTMDRNAPIGTP